MVSSWISEVSTSGSVIVATHSKQNKPQIKWLCSEWTNTNNAVTTLNTEEFLIASISYVRYTNN
jgi:hypothetical protein